MNHLPVFTTSRLLLKELTLAYVDSYKKHFVDYEVIRNLSARVPWPYPENGVQDFIEQFILPEQGVKRWAWGIFLKEQPDELIGVVELWREGKPENRAFWLGRKFWGNGYMTEAVRPVMDYAFGELGFETLKFSNAVGNKRSARIKEKTGARFVERQPMKFVDPAFTEHEIFELTKEQWNKFKKAEY